MSVLVIWPNNIILILESFFYVVFINFIYGIVFYIKLGPSSERMN